MAVHLPSTFRLLTIGEMATLPFRAFVWWYSEGIRELLVFCAYHIRWAEDTFSLREMALELVKFSPLHRDYGQKFLDTLTARGIGLVVRGGWVLAALLLIILLLLLSVTLIVFWLLFPLFLLFELGVTIAVMNGIWYGEFLHQEVGRILASLLPF